MPLYEYQCDDCRHCFEKLQMRSDEPREFICPQCGSGQTRKLMSCASFIGGAGGLCSPGGESGFS